MSKKTEQHIINKIIELGSSKTKQKDIMFILNVPRGIVQKTLKEHNIHNRSCRKFSTELVEEIRQLVKQGKCKTAISDITGASKALVPQIIKDYNLEMVMNTSTRRGRKKEWTKEDIELMQLYHQGDFKLIDLMEKTNVGCATLLKKCKELGFEKATRTFDSDAEADYFIENHQKKTLDEMAKERRMTPYGVEKKLYKIGLGKKPIPWHIRPAMPKTEEFWHDYSNPYITHASLSMKYDIAPHSIAKWRSHDFGVGFTATKKAGNCGTMIEHKIAKILSEVIDVTYFQQYHILKYNVDFYLGNKLIIECNGERWHASKKSTEKDKKKYDELNKLGYSILILDEKLILSDAKKVQELIEGLYKFKTPSQHQATKEGWDYQWGNSKKAKSEMIS